MLKIVTLSLLLASVYCWQSSDARTKYIIKRMVDSEYTDIKDVPYLAQIIGTKGYKNQLICGGSIISNQWIITAGHCVMSGFVVNTIATGNKRPNRGQKHKVEKLIYHEEYDPYTNENDIALIKVTKPIIFSPRQHRIAIATSTAKPGDQLKVSGLGSIGNRFQLNFMWNMNSRSIKTAVIPVISNEECEAIYRYDSIITSNMFCAGRGGDDSCQGDSGGPAVINDQLSGIVTGGNDCGSRYWSGVYTRLQPYLNWISAMTKLDLQSLVALEA